MFKKEKTSPTTAINELIKASVGFEKIIQLSEKLSKTVNDQDEKKLRRLDIETKQKNVAILQATATLLGQQIIVNPKLFHLALKLSPLHSCFSRYIIVPILYKLGFTQEAAELNQATFSALFPLLNRKINEALQRLLGTDLQVAFDKIAAEFSPQETTWNCYARLKSNASLWNKITSIKALETMSLLEFCEQINDFIGLRWHTTFSIDENENRYDANIKGVKALPTQGLYLLRNQHKPQDNGFSCEPLIKAYYIIEISINGLTNTYPVELQLLAGHIEYYLCAKGYSNYKAGLVFPPLNLSNEEQNARLGSCLYYQENNLAESFQQLMLDELQGKIIHYNHAWAYNLAIEPNKAINKAYRFSTEKGFFYQNAQITITSPACILSNLVTQQMHRAL